MPWQAHSTLETKREFVELASAPYRNMRALCRQFGVSPEAGYEVVRRFVADGEAGLHDRSRRPKRTPFRVSDAIERAVCAVRLTNPLWGPRRIAGHLSATGATNTPAPSTVGEILKRNGLVSTTKDAPLDWLLPLVYGQAVPPALPERLAGMPDLGVLLDRVRTGRVWDRKRAATVLAHQYGTRASVITQLLGVSWGSYRRTLKLFSEGGATALFARRKNPHSKVDDEAVKATVFTILHQPPSSFGINRTTWTMGDLSRVAARLGKPVSESVISAIVKQAGYRWRKARVVLTSNDPEYSEKVAHIQDVLRGLAPDEVFFSIDEYGPFAVKAQPGRSLAAPGERREVPQWQRSKGCLILTAAIELSTNQVTHFYSDKKNTAEMVRMMEALVDQYGDRRKIYLSWDAASWHISKALFDRIAEHNARIGDAGPLVDTAPLPSRAQFLNVVESIFSGMARAIIHNSDYPSVDAAKAAIDRYFAERNAHFREHPKRAGGKIWGKERTSVEFSASSNCKDPRLG